MLQIAITCLYLNLYHMIAIMSIDTSNKDKKPASPPVANSDEAPETVISQTDKPSEKGGPKGPEPTRYGDWESGGRCTDF